MNDSSHNFSKINISNTDFIITRISNLNIDDNRIETFCGESTEPLPKYLKNTTSKGAYQQDKNNKNAVYVVIDKETNEIAFYYALRTSMCEQTDNDNLGILSKVLKRVKSLCKHGVVKIDNVIPTIDLSMFCKNTNYSRVNNIHDFGSSLFYSIIYQQVSFIKDIVAIQYITLNAADNGSGKLIDYYKDKLAFVEYESLGILPIQERYDKGCKFLIHPIEQLEH